MYIIKDYCLKMSEKKAFCLKESEKKEQIKCTVSELYTKYLYGGKKSTSIPTSDRQSSVQNNNKNVSCHRRQNKN